jgi:hypothetical protein
MVHIRKDPKGLLAEGHDMGFLDMIKLKKKAFYN